MKRHKNIFLSLLFIVSALVLYYFLVTGGIFFHTPYFIFSVPILNICGIFFAFRSKRLKESSRLGKILGVMGIVILVFILLTYAFETFVIAGCAGDSAGC